MSVAAGVLAGAVAVAPESLLRWQPFSLTFDGPDTSEDALPNAFLNYRMSVVFTHPQSGESRTVRGFFAADGNAAETSADSGDKWRIRFTPPFAGICA